MKVFCIGTLAADFYLTETSSTYFIGGISSNVAIGLATTGMTPTLITRIGKDSLGHILKDKLIKKGVTVINRYSKNPTPIILVESDTDNNISYVAHLTNTSYAELYPDDVPNELKSNESNTLIVLDGTILQNSHLHYWFLPFLENYKKEGGTIVFDINWRDHLTTEAAIILQKMVGLSDIIKGTPEEFSLLGDNPLETIINTKYHDKIFLLTKASKGCSIYYKTKSVALLPIKAAEIVDPSGCGDAFVAGFTKGYIDLLSKLKKIDLEVVDLIPAARLGTYLASKIITTRGSNNYPDNLPDLNHYY